MGIEDKLKDIPHSPGVYIMRDGEGEIIYIGKAKDLSKRVASYFQKARPATAKEMALLDQVSDLEYMLTTSEEEALIYEANLIKENKPRYNVELKDDKSFPYLKLTLKEDFPRLLITRKRRKDGSRYFGPYTRVKLLRKALSIIKGIFPLRSCRVMPEHTCLFYHIGQCAGPCEGKIDRAAYADIVRQLILFLEGKKADLLDELRERMNRLARERRFEEAAVIRNRISALSEVPGKRMVDYGGWGSVAIRLKRLLGLPWLPLRVEAFDVSNIRGREATGSMVSFLNGRPDKSHYRRFRIKGVKAIDDYAMVREVVRRRYTRLKEEEGIFPDLIIIDGGKGHLRAAYGELMKLNLTRIPVISIAKEEERIYVLGRKDPIKINMDSEVMHFLQHLRDEAHRFAIKYHHKLREKKFIDKKRG